ncbi:MAG: SpoVG family protein [Candidatus Omnitrophota bacterium]
MDENLIQINRIHRFDGESKLKAFVDVTLAGFLIKGLRIVEGKNGLFLGMPRQQGKDGKWYNSVSTVTKETHQELTDFILAAYKEQE